MTKLDGNRRVQIINKIIDDDISSIIQNNMEGDDYYITSLLCNGIRGYFNYTDDELLEELEERDINVE